MTVVSYSYARKNFRSLINKVNTDLDFVTITTNEHNAVLISENNYNAIMETLYLQQSPANAKHLAKSIADLERGNTTEIDMDSNE
ncbi:type II toxin-antitoxin system Phd/YefM family antitoxin [Staphylococcus pasteuri]|uniref:type II toxin-antitoxin system Phd/YefM family antitoxin n=1 Tax=Staphylococcus TaxID=1279 RepID=UPI00048FADEA|nr:MULTISPECIES: type II toxin-antitoxin system Phd/YefM family antitoxin [Staphylococcus]MBL3398722.1 type II toxin-antitoxin system Phd/YefM family antitoxin [Staphylococcus pasteuri]MEB6612499.1 type II toxin-antitoxin system Phd/YefM family antitoxin [Staphylococcus pasteuri]QQN54040.1 type II toxin-antitoxin system Phd/YefM family antitoxin [Staphylococcus pasteuri]RFD67335.1 prevent-host-death protein [Staphylococcus pasteuri]RNM19463.1 type II toxin-antitoxin system Phd/YefM family anti